MSAKLVLKKGELSHGKDELVLQKEAGKEKMEAGGISNAQSTQRPFSAWT